jgi:hypothetical protein
MSHEQLILAFLNEEEKKPDAATGTAVPLAAEPPPAKTRSARTNKLSASLRSLPTIVREIIHPEVLAAPDDFRLLGEETSERLRRTPKIGPGAKL